NKVYVVFGQALDGTGTLNLDALNPTQGFVLTNGTGQAGQALAVADVDGDGVQDILIGAPNANPVAPAGDRTNVRGFGGQVYVVFGANNIGQSGPIDLATLDGTNGTVLEGQHRILPSDAEENADLAEADSAGASISGAGDINGDGEQDIIIGAPHMT